MEKKQPRSEEKDWTRRVQEWEQAGDTHAWDSPGDDLWGRIATDLPDPSPARKKAGWLWWSLGVLSLLIAISGYWAVDREIKKEEKSPAPFVIHSPKMTAPAPAERMPGINNHAVAHPSEANNQALSTPSTPIANVSPPVKDAMTSSPISKPSPASESLKAKDELAKAEESEPSARAVEESPRSLAITSVPTPEETRELLPAAEQIEEALPTQHVDGTLSPILPTKERPSVAEDYPFAAVSLLPSLLKPLPSFPLAELSVDPVLPSLKANWYLGAQFSIPQVQRQRRGPHRIQSQSNDPRLELWVGRTLGRRWQVELGYAQEGSQLLRQTSFVRRFNPQNEQVEDDQNVSVFALNVVDDSGNTNQDVELRVARRPGQSILPGDRVLIQTDIREQIRIRSIPIRVGYEVASFRSWRFQAMLGAEWQSQHRTLNLERVVVQHPWLDPLTLPERQRIREQQRDVFRYTAGLRTSFQFNSQWGVYVQPQVIWGGRVAQGADLQANMGAFWRF